MDFLTFLVGAVPISATTHALPDVGKYREDNVSMVFTFPDGSIGVVDYLANGDKSLPKERVEVFCGGRVAVLDDFRVLEMIQDGRRKKIKGSQDKGWKDEWRAFARAIRDGGEPPIPYEQLVGVTSATFAAQESLRKDGSPLKIGASRIAILPSRYEIPSNLIRQHIGSSYTHSDGGSGGFGC